LRYAFIESRWYGKFFETNGYDSVYLWTFQGLDSARHLYEKYGFSLSEERTGEQWGSIVTEQRFNMTIDEIPYGKYPVFTQ